MYMHIHIKINACVVRKDVRGANNRNRTLNIKTTYKHVCGKR